MVARSDAHPGIVGIAMGTLDGDLPHGPKQHWNVASKASWFEITDQLPQFSVVPGRP